ncbi:hypothetical protein [Polaribacter sp. IC073]|uniref:hypothetical protein n=1 Tax=Polaribacter sp. IC073 TaxID=2508540 RepID=UPI0011BE9DA8|nr:hypothetical protein [Polaribacter sp. IC073]TXD47351.1 hypothetical protein ES045_12195 [Polaribacter sp. IC073]
MVKKYTLKQLSTSINIDESLLSKDQVNLRLNARKKPIEEEKLCKTCGLIKDVKDDFRVRLIKNSYYRVNATCRDCTARKRGVKEIGKLKFGKVLLDKGLRKCTTCQDIKPLNEFGNSEKLSGSKQFSCLDCNRIDKDRTKKSGFKYITSITKKIGSYWKVDVWHNNKHNFVGVFEFNEKGLNSAVQVRDNYLKSLKKNII